MIQRGCFISLEGLEGVGKTTNRDYIHQTLSKASIDVLVTREPGGTSLGEALRNLLLHADTAVDLYAETLMMAASRRQHVVEVIEPALAAGRWVLCDRFADASFAYQGGGRKLGAQMIAQLHALAEINVQPDITFLLDMPVRAGLDRMAARGKPDRIEQEEQAFFDRARSAYLARAKAEPTRIKCIDASVALEDVQSQIKALLDEFITAANSAASAAKPG